MLVTLLDAFVQNLAFPALLISAGLLILVSNRDAFDVDTKPRDDIDPATGTVRRTWQWKYSSDRAENARLELLHLVRVLRWLATLMCVLAVLLFLVAGVVGSLEIFGYGAVTNWWKSDPTVQLVFEHGLAILFILIGPVLIVRLSRVVSNVIRARDIPAANKPPGWTPY